ncbi:hypothetical protein V7S79_01830 [Aquirufa sp. ROCK-SH2]
MVLRNFTIFIFCLLLSNVILAQSYFPILDQNPSQLKWRQIPVAKTPFKIVYSANNDSLAQITANYIQNNYTKISDGFNVKAHDWSIILQNQGVISNGFVTLIAPRVEFIMTKPQTQSLISINQWNELLTSHELRHVYQFERTRKGLGKLAFLLFGNSFTAGASTLYLPNWLFEGDAVETETRLNPTGRSKIPQFYLPMLAYLSEYPVPSYAKLNARSFSELVPNHYVFGQILSQSFIKNFGLNSMDFLWAKTFDKMTPFAFSNSVKALTGKSIDRYSYDLFSNIKDSIQKNQPINQEIRMVVSPSIQSGYTRYDYPQWIGYETFVAIKSGLGAIPTLVKIAGKKEVELMKLAPKVDDEMLSANKDFVVFSAIKYHPRWAQKQSSKIVIFDLKNKTKRFWDIGLKWMSPSISSDSKYLSILQQNENGTSELIVFDFNTQEIINSFPLGLSEDLVHPRISDSNRLVFIQKSNGKKIIIVWDFVQNKIIHQFDLGSNNASHPFLSDEKVYFSVPQNGVDQIACWDITNNRIYRITQTNWGAYHPAIHEIGHRLLYSNYTAKGTQIIEKKVVVDSLSLLNVAGDVDLSHTETSAPFQKFPSKKYHQFLNIHSWGPFASSQNTNQLDLSIASRNILNTLQIGAGLSYNANERAWNQFAKFSFQKWFPVFDFSWQNGPRKTSLYIDKYTPLDSIRTDSWQQMKIDFGIRLPFNLTHSAYQENLTLVNNYSILQVQGYQLPLRYNTEAFDGNYFSTINQLSYYKLLSKSALDVQSRKGFMLNFYWQSMPKAQSIKSELWSIQTKVFLPGFTKHDGISFRYAYQHQLSGNYFFASPIVIPRGDLYQNFQEYHSFSVDYKFPILNRSIDLGKWLYFKRFKGNLFYDFGQGVSTSKVFSSNANYHSFGVDLLSQISFMRFSQVVELGVRALYKPQTRNVEVYPLVLEIGF